MMASSSTSASSAVYAAMSDHPETTLTEYLSSRKTTPLVDIAHVLGVSAVQLRTVWFAEAEQEGRIAEAYADNLARRIRQHCPNGTGSGSDPRLQVAGAIADWVADVLFRTPNPVVSKNELVAAGTRFLDELNPGGDWLPFDGSDHVILAALTPLRF